MGACGLDNRCCSRFLTEFSPISIKMAKEQGISLTPSEITGMCGRLRCCLVYEYEQYAEARKDLPKRGKRVRTASGEGKVEDVNPLKQTVIIYLESGTRVEVPYAEVQPLDELEALQQKTSAQRDSFKDGETGDENLIQIGNLPEVKPGTGDKSPTRSHSFENRMPSKKFKRKR
jgi:cell fate regulator YaaT (PSP1 superfamily)